MAVNTQITRLISTGTRLIESCFKPLPKANETVVSNIWARFNQTHGDSVCSPGIKALFALQELVRGVDAQMRLSQDLLINYGNQVRRIRPTISPDFLTVMNSNLDHSNVQQRFDNLAMQFQEALAVSDRSSLKTIKFPLIRFAKADQKEEPYVSQLISDVFDRSMQAALNAPEHVESRQERSLPVNKYACFPEFARHLDAQIRILYPYSLLIDDDRRRGYGNARDAAGMSMVSSKALDRFQVNTFNLPRLTEEPEGFSKLTQQLTQSLSNLWRYTRAEVMATLVVPDYFPEDIQQFYRALLDRVIQDALKIPGFSAFGM